MPRELLSAVELIRGLFDGIERGRLERWRELASLVDDIGADAAAEHMRRRSWGPHSPASLRRHAAVAARLSARDWARIMAFHDRGRRMLRGGHVSVLANLPRPAWDRCFELMEDRLWTVKELRAWAATRSRRPKLVVVRGGSG